MTGFRKLLFGTLAVLGLFILMTCSLLPGDLEDGVIAIKVGIPSGSRALEVKEYDVESLDIAIYGPDGALLEDFLFHWTPPDSEMYWVKGIGQGQYRVVVTHNGVNGDENLSLVEEDVFNVAVMKITTISIVPGLLSMVEVEGEEEIDITGYWTATWISDDFGGAENPLTPLYTYMLQDGNDVLMAHGMLGSLDGNTLTTEGDLGDMGYLEGTATVDGDIISGNFTLTGEDESGNPTVTEVLQSMVPTPPALFGHMEITGTAAGTTMDLNTEFAMAGYGISGEEYYDDGLEVWVYEEKEGLELSFLDEVSVVGISFNIDSSIGLSEDTSYLFYPEGTPSELYFIARYLENDVGFSEFDSEGTMFSGELYLDDLVYLEDPALPGIPQPGSYVSGWISATGVNNMEVEFNIPLSPEQPF